MANNSPQTSMSVESMVDLDTYTATFAEDDVVDTLGFDFAVVKVRFGACSTGTMTAADLDIVVNSGSSAAGTAHAAITSAAFNNNTAASDDTTLLGAIDLRQQPRYLSCDGTITGATPSFVLGIEVLLFRLGEASDWAADTYTFAV